MAKARVYGYFKPVTPNCRAWCPKRKMKAKTKTRKDDANAKTVGKQLGPA